MLIEQPESQWPERLWILMCGSSKLLSTRGQMVGVNQTNYIRVNNNFWYHRSYRDKIPPPVGNSQGIQEKMGHL